MSKKPKLSGYEYKKQRQGDNERLVESLSAFLTRDADADCELSEVFTDAGLWPMPMTDAAVV